MIHIRKREETYITIPYKKSIQNIRKVIDKIEAGKKLTEADVKGLS